MAEHLIANFFFCHHYEIVSTQLKKKEAGIRRGLLVACLFVVCLFRVGLRFGGF